MTRNLSFDLCSCIAYRAVATLDRQATTDRQVPELRVRNDKGEAAKRRRVIVSEKHDPRSCRLLTLLGGSHQFQPAERRGVGSLTAAMMSEGTKTRNGDDLSNALQLLGTNVSVGVGAEKGSMSFVSTTARFAATLDILADMLVNSTFPPEALERLRAQRLVALNQAKAQPGSIAARVFPRVVYGDAHPLGQSSTEQTVKAITRADVVDFHQRYFKPGRALITVVGDVTAAAVRPVIEKGLANWSPGGERPVFSYPPLPAAKPMTIYLVDKPGSAQSTFALGLPGPPRTTPDYYALRVMNTILGGSFTSRLKATSARRRATATASARVWLRKGRSFRTAATSVGDKDRRGMVEFMNELRGILGRGRLLKKSMRRKDRWCAPAGDLRVGERDQRRVDGTVAAVAAGQLLPAVHEVGDGGYVRRRGARGKEIYRP